MNRIGKLGVASAMVILSTTMGRCSAPASQPPNVAHPDSVTVNGNELTGCSNVTFGLGGTVSLQCPHSNVSVLRALEAAMLNQVMAGSRMVILYHDTTGHAIHLINPKITKQLNSTAGFTVSFIYESSSQT